MIDPVKEFIAKTRLTHNAFAVLHGISLQRLKNCLYGYTPSIPQKIMCVMVQNDYDEKTPRLNILNGADGKSNKSFMPLPRQKEG